MSQTNTSDALAYVAHTFAEAYYGLLVDPENFTKLYTFYQLDAVFTRGEEAKGQNDASTTIGLEPIKKELAHFHSQVRNCEVNLKVMDSQYSISQGIVLTAVGSFDRVENGALKSRRFVQTFFLEAQTPNSYSIRNDMLRYLNETPKTVVIAKEEAKPHAVPAPTAATNGTESHTPAAATPAAESNGESKKPQQQVVPQEKKKPAATGTTAATAASPTAARKGRQNRKGDDKPRRETKADEQPQVKSSKPATWANVVSGNAVAGTPPAVEQPKPKAAPRQHAQPAQQQSQQPQQPKLVKDKKPKQESGFSLYVGNLPFESSSEQVYNLFAKYGAIKEVVLKRGYGFVEFVSLDDMKKALDAFEASPVELDGRRLDIEDRKRGERTGVKPNTRGPKPAAAKRGGKTGGRPNDNGTH